MSALQRFSLRETVGEILRWMRDLCLANVTEPGGSMQVQ